MQQLSASAAHSNNSDNSTTNDEEPRFKKMKPRVGSQYQIKVPKAPCYHLGGYSPYESDRPAPNKLSNEYTHLTLEEVETAMQPHHDDDSNTQSKNELSSLHVPPTYRIRQADVPRSFGETNQQRIGGMCVHRYDNVRNMEAISEQQQPVLSNGAFCQEMISRYGSSSSSNNNKTKRGRKKRAATAITMPDAAEEWTSCPALTRHTSNYYAATRMLFPHDEEARLQQLENDFGGNVDIAELDMRVRLTNGTARKARRILLKTLHSNRFKRPSQLSSASWRERLELTTGIWGDLRTSTDKASWRWDDYDDIADTHSTILVIESCEEDPLASVDDDMKGVWRSILAYGQSMERTISDPGATSKPSVREVTNFLRHAYALPMPEEAFGSRHVCVEQLSECFHNLLDHVSKARDALAEILDFLADDEDGVDVDSLRKLLDERLPKICPLSLNEETMLRHELVKISDWQARLDSLLENPQGEDDCLSIAIGLAQQARAFGIRTRDLVSLEKRIERAYHLQNRLDGWDKEGNTNTVKSVAALVRDANRVNLPSASVRRLWGFNKELESWVERSNIAIRSRISLSEVKSLIHHAKSMPLNLGEFLDKLHARVRLAKSWMAQLEEVVPRVCKTDDEGKTIVDHIEWMKRMRHALGDDQNRGSKCNSLLELCSEGGRIPVEITVMKMLQIELDAKNWSQKAEKWIPRTRDSRRGKIEELREHLAKAELLRDRLPFEDKSLWVLDYEAEIKSIVKAADAWFEEFRVYVEWDNRRSSPPECLSLDKLRRIVSEGNAIHANMGNSVTKMARVLGQAENWFEKNLSLLCRAGVRDSDGNSAVGTVTLLELTNAVAEASSEISLDLQEALALQEIVDKILSWVDRVSNAAPIKRSKRVGKGRWSSRPTRFREKDLVDLIEEAKTLPIPTGDEVLRLQTQLDEVNAWRIKAHRDLKEIANGFHNLGASIESMHGSCEDFFSDQSRLRIYADRGKASLSSETIPREIEANVDAMEIDDIAESGRVGADSAPDLVEVYPITDLGSSSHSQVVTSIGVATDVNDDLGSQMEVTSSGESSSNPDKECQVERLISTLLHEARQTGVMTREEDLIASLEIISKWCSKTLRALEHPHDLYEKRTYAGFNSLMESGEALLEVPIGESGLDGELEELLRNSWSSVVRQQLVRLENLRTHRDKFVEWSKVAQILLSAKDKKLTFEAIDEIAEQSRQYPSSTDIVQRIRSLAQRACNWRERVKAQINSTERKMTMLEAKAFVDEGDKLKLVCQELKVLRNAIRSTKLWMAQVKKCKVELGATAAADLESLIDEHDSLLIAVPEEVDKLKQATKGFCLCRRSYEGFMIGCDSCEEWYHGSCIGVSVSQADRYEKYVCVRCCVKRVFDGSAINIANIIRKWTSKKDCKKARQAEYQKHQRRVRKERKDIDKFELKLSELRRQLESLKHPCDAVKSEPENQRFISAQFESSGTPSVDDEVEHPSHNHNTASNVSGQDQLAFEIPEVETKTTLSTPSTVVNDTMIVPHGTKLAEQWPGQADGHMEETGSSNTDVFDTIQASKKLDINDSLVDKEAEAPTESREEIESQINELLRSIGSCHQRLDCLRQAATERADLDTQEDRYSDRLKIWCIRVRSLVLVPSSQDLADCSRPFSDGSLSQPMLALFEDAEALGIAKFQDVDQVANGLRCICWASLAMSTLARRCSLKAIQHVLNCCSAITLSDEKAIKMLKSMVQRSTIWQSKVRKALTPKPGETKPFSMELLNSIDSGSNTLPFEMPETTCLANAIDDKGCRHCLCGGPNDGTFMLGCDKCEQWFHGRCVKVSNETGSNLDRWLCPLCNGEKIELADFYVDEFDPVEIEEDDSANQESAPCAPTVEKLWPPFKLLGSTESIEALGDECLRIPDSLGHFEPFHDGLVSTCAPVLDQTTPTSSPQHVAGAMPVSSDLVPHNCNSDIGAPSSSPIFPEHLQTTSNISSEPHGADPAFSTIIANLAVDIAPLSPTWLVRNVENGETMDFHTLPHSLSGNTVMEETALDFHRSSHSISLPIMVPGKDCESDHSQSANVISETPRHFRSCDRDVCLPNMSATGDSSTVSRKIEVAKEEGVALSCPDDTRSSVECVSQGERVEGDSACESENPQIKSLQCWGNGKKELTLDGVAIG